MFATFRNAWKVTELRSKILFTLLILFIYRLGAQIPVPYISAAALESFTAQTEGSIFAYMNILSGGAFGQATLFALSVSPYITAQIIIQLLTVAIPALERMSKEGEEGRRKITAITRYATVLLSLITAYGYMQYMDYYGWLSEGVNWFGKLVIVLCYCAGSSVIMWLAEKINDFGIGNGISMILFANIISRGPALVGQIIAMVFPTMNLASFKWTGLILAIVSVVITLAIVVLVVWFTESERRIPIQYAKRVVGRKMYGGQSSNLPIKLNMTGVMPVIFASSIVSIPATIASFFPNSNFWKSVTSVFNFDGWLYFVLYLVLIVLFAYFYVMISFNPVEVANNIQKNGGSIPGIRSGRPTVQYIKKILNRITLIGAIFLCFIAGFPMLINIITSALGTTFAGLAFGGNSLLIVVGVALETHRDLEAQVALRSYGGSKSKGIFG